MWKFVPWRLVLLIVGLLLVALFAAGQAVTFAWLSSFPERASQLDALEIKFWSYATLSAVLVIIDLILLVRLVKQTKNRARHTNVSS
jgi:membrane protein implicated in regulation of membrane protease activity